MYGRSFDLVTDHKPLLALMSEHRPTSPQASARVKRWSLLLSAYEYTLLFRGTEEHQNADTLSRLPLPEMPTDVPLPGELVLLLDHLNDSPVTATDICVWTRRDPTLAKVVEFVQRGWPDSTEEQLKPFSSRKDDLSVLKGCLLWGSRVVVPEAGREAVLTELHVGHPGMSKMKALSRMYVWWPGLDQDIEKAVKMCNDCQENKGNTPGVPLQPWSWPSQPWSRIHIDYAGPFLGTMFLIVVDACTKWIEAIPTASATSSATIEILKTIFARFGLPELVVSDNGQCFVSEEFKSFLSTNGIKQLTSAPYHPSSNGLAERAVQVVKAGLKKNSSGSLTSRLAKTLLCYRTTPHSTTGVTPAEMMLGRRPKIRLDLVKPSLVRDVEISKAQMKFKFDSSARDKQFTAGDTVYVKNFRREKRWLPGTVVSGDGSVILQVRLEDGTVVRRHKEHVKPRVVRIPEVEQIPASEETADHQLFPSSVSTGTSESSNPSESTEPTDTNGPSASPESNGSTETSENVATPSLVSLL